LYHTKSNIISEISHKRMSL